MSVKPFMHWAIYKKYGVRITRRQPHAVEGWLTTPQGRLSFRYETDPRLIHLPAGTVAINQYGWELPQDAGQPTEHEETG